MKSGMSTATSLPRIILMNQSNETRVVHCKKEPYDIYIGRGSIWGNPFIVGKDGTREEVISKYEAYIMNSKKLIDQLHTLVNKTLGCWCKPEACHGDILKIMVEDEIWNK